VKYLERSKKIEEQVFEAIEEITDEMKLKIPHYPEVYWLGRGVEFEYLGLPHTFKSDFVDTKREKAGIYLSKPKVILLARDSPSYIGEEASHFVHHEVSRIKTRGKSKLDQISANILIEMLGYFGSKLVNPYRPNPFRNSTDLLSNQKDKVERFKKKIMNVYGEKESFFDEILIHQQGYSLGERLFIKYSLGEIDVKKINALYSNPLAKPGEATLEFFKLRGEFWPIDNLKTSSSLAHLC
jgi:hypothetical protein